MLKLVANAELAAARHFCIMVMVRYFAAVTLAVQYEHARQLEVFRTQMQEDPSDEWWGEAAVGSAPDCATAQFYMGDFTNYQLPNGLIKVRRRVTLLGA
jgi:hypothetical protein